ncbi:MAG: hypothetical protein PVH87_19360 [Desulfobacteraceae bacterium]
MAFKQESPNIFKPANATSDGACAFGAQLFIQVGAAIVAHPEPPMFIPAVINIVTICFLERKITSQAFAYLPQA